MGVECPAGVQISEVRDEVNRRGWTGVLCVGLDVDLGDNIRPSPNSGNVVEHQGLEAEINQNVRISIVCQQSACKGLQGNGGER